MSRLVSILLLWFASGCYFYYPKIPKTPRPEVVEGERVEVVSADAEYMASCDPTRERTCGISKGEWKKKASYTIVGIRYNGKTLNQFEYRKLVDPAFEKKLDRVRSNKGVCNISLVPSVISAIGVAALAIASPFYDKLGDKAAIVGWGSAGVAAGGALLSYPLGGFACRRARNQYKALFTGVDPDDTEFILNFGYGDVKGNDGYVEEMMKLTQNFNARFGTKTDEPVEVPTED